jgi:hypothetical protein
MTGDEELESIYSYKPAPELWGYAKVVVEHFVDDFNHLSELELLCLFTGKEIEIGRCRKSAYVLLPQAQGQNRKIYNWTLNTLFGFVPEVILVVDEELWKEMPDPAKIALVHHELSHIIQKETERGGPSFSKETGRPALELKDHDVEEFFQTAALFGEYAGDLTRLRHTLENETNRVAAKQIKQLTDRVKKINALGWRQQGELQIEMEK